MTDGITWKDLVIVMKIQKVVCPTDFSEASHRALTFAQNLSSSNIEIVVVHVEPAADQLVDLSNRAPFAEAAAERRAGTVKNLCAVMEEYVSTTNRVRPALRQGEAAIEIVRTAREEAADMIILTAHGAGQDDPECLGTVAAEVIRTAPCPVLIVNQPTATGAQPSSSVERFDFSALRPALQVASPHAIYLDGD